MEEEYTVIEPVDDETEQDNDTATAGDVRSMKYLPMSLCIQTFLPSSFT